MLKIEVCSLTSLCNVTAYTTEEREVDECWGVGLSLDNIHWYIFEDEYQPIPDNWRIL
jgi:hypothetical protein